MSVWNALGKFNLFKYSIFFIVSLEGIRMVIMDNRGLQNNYIGWMSAWWYTYNIILLYTYLFLWVLDIAFIFRLGFSSNTVDNNNRQST